MDARVKALWTARLRSGQDEQGRGYLNKDGKLCCKGVLCQIAKEDGVEVSETRDELYPGVTLYDSAWGLLPESVVKWAGFTEYEAERCPDDAGPSAIWRVSVMLDKSDPEELRNAFKYRWAEQRIGLDEVNDETRYENNAYVGQKFGFDVIADLIEKHL